MKLYLISLFVCLLAIETKGQNSTSKQCKAGKDGNDVDTCMMHLLLVGDPKYVFPETKAAMSSHCKNINKYEKCIKDYSSKCLTAFPRQVTSVLAYGVAKTNKGYCSNRRRKEQFIAMGKCGNSIKASADTCMKQYIDSLQGTENFPDITVKIPMACCNFYQMKSCIIKKAENAENSVCSETNVEEIERIIDGYAFDVLQLLCGDYTEDSDKCGKILPKTPKRLTTQKRYKSLLPPFINILSSVPQQ